MAGEEGEIRKVIMGLYNPKIDCSTGWNKQIKRIMNKWLRREAKRDPENAPRKRRYCGWTL